MQRGEGLQPRQPDLLTTRPVPELSTAQLERFTPESLRAKTVAQFDSAHVLNTLQESEGKRAMGIDLGGDKIRAITYEVQRGGKLQPVDSEAYQSSGGRGYLNFLEEVSQNAERNGIVTGVSFAGPVEGTRPIAGPNVQTFMEEFKSNYDGDFANLLPTVRDVANDAEAGIKTAIIAREGPNKLLYIINGGGLGGAAYKDGNIVAAEPGHIPVINTLNQYGQDKPCGMDGASYVCIESIGGSGAGVEDLWERNRGEQLSGELISKKYQQGDELAGDLYENSALITAHAVRGMGDVLSLIEKDTVIAGHGGIFNVPGYANRTEQILAKDLGYVPNMILTKDVSQNACAEGAAIAALTAE